MALLVYFLLFLALTGHSRASYCICNDGVSDQALQRNIDYACGAGADCTPILQNGACYQPNTVKDHCNWAVNSYYQRKGEVQGSCDFAGTATVSQTAPSTSSSSCVFPSSATSTTGTPSTTPSTSTGTSTGTGTGTGTSTSPTVFSMSPSSSTGFSDNSNGGVAVLESIKLLFPLVLTFWLAVVLRL